MAEYYALETGSVDLSSDQAIYDRLMYFAFAPEMVFESLADVGTTEQGQRGSSIIFTKYDALTVSTTPLVEKDSKAAILMGDSQVTVTLAEYGETINTTEFARATSFDNIDESAAKLLGTNAGVTIDTLVRDVAVLGTNVNYATGGASTPTSRATVGSDDILTAADLRAASLVLIAGSTPKLGGGYYNGFIHPNVAADIMSETGDAGWLVPHAYVNTDNIYTNEMGVYAGVRWITTPRASRIADASDGSGSSTGSSATVDVYLTLIGGYQALAKGYSTGEGRGPNPQSVQGAVTDPMRRFHPQSWKHLVGYSIFRQESLVRIESAASGG